MIATLIKEGRLAKGFTQKELSELPNVSVRSIQRIENAELVPRSFTLKTLASILDLPFESFHEEYPGPELQTGKSGKLNKSQKIILSIGVCLALILIAAAFIAQSPRFPETQFEAINFIVIVVIAITAVLLLVWRK